MKTVRIVLLLALIFTTVLAVSAQKKGLKTVVYNASLHCDGCKNKIEKNIPYEKGVKDLKVNLEEKTVTVTFNEDKNSTENIQKAIEKLGFKVTAVTDTKDKEKEKK